jgi:AcrR family transcriptional regulator
MPKQTFFNLPEDKRARVLEAAISEFGLKPFNKVSVSDIVEKAEIPRGSFYQYFEDLKDLYRHVLEVAGEQKMLYLQDVVAQLDKWDVFKILRELFAAGLKFGAENPRLAAVGNNFWREDPSMRREVFPDLKEQGWGFFEMLLSRGRDRGEVDAGVDIRVTSVILYYLTNAITEYYMDHAEAGKNLFEEKEDYLELVEKMLYILEVGLRSRKGGETSP